ncbi:bacteriohemerythrin [Shewanella aestuarii]|uniref:cyclic-guanylate-specific phosphodiesterase n=1 Tax=Shewanella aestuarii TaxID=1028752 RepID=A0A6G9QL98_9GAMM|nr:bacteriohemerythrin [Shewanella aestuarii]QIR14611.1 bacteriohemerythrin [Shewanella aestuarii]
MTETYVDIFPWNDSFNVGVSEIDQQHEVLVRLLNEVASCIAFQRADINLDKLITELVNYAVYHFETEEKYWNEMLPASVHTEQHKKGHASFVNQVNDLKQDINHLPEDVWLEKLLSFLASWLASHILESDKYMALLVFAIKSGMNLEQASIVADDKMVKASKETINVILAAYKSLSENTIRLMREIKTGNQTLEKLIEIDQHLQDAMDYAQIGRWSFPYNGKTADWSVQMYRIFGLEPDTEAGPETLCKIMDEDYQQAFYNSLQHCFATGEEHHVEYPIVRPKDGQTRWIECRGKLIYGNDGSPLKISGFIQDISVRKENEAKVSQLAYFDPLTSLPNRQLLFDRLNQAIALSERNKDFYALLFIDLDDFKTINDSRGHEYGDILLQQAAIRIQQCIRKGDTIARFGGDEFVVVLSELDKTELKAAAISKQITHKILLSLSAPYEILTQQFDSSASIGIMMFNGSQISASKLMRQADIAMYQAKKSGKNSACFYDPEMQNKINLRIGLERDLRIGIKEHQFELFYQPQVDNKNCVIGAEALIRWHHPKQGMISPDLFIPIAEETGLILPIGHWVLETACKQLQQWQKNSQTAHLTLSVNVSYKQFRQVEFVSQVTHLLNEYQLEQGKLKIELTESMLVDKMEFIILSMQQLQSQGVQISLDDFGTGYSSLQYLKRLPLSQLKIDRSFVSDLEKDANDKSIVETIILMAKALSLNVIAEGVETLQQKEYLAEHGCFCYQGYYFGKPMPIGEFESLESIKSD